MNEEYGRSIIRRQTESFLSLLAGLRRVPVRNEEDIVYNNALGDVFDYYIEKEPEHLYVSTVNRGNGLEIRRLISCRPGRW